MARRRKKSGQAAAAAGDSGIRARVLKWIAFVAAIVSLILGINELLTMNKNARERRRQIAELVSSASVQKGSGDFSGAWASLEKASQADPSNRDVQRAQEDLAMAWLESGRPGPNAKFFDLTDKVTPVLSRAATSEDRVRRADAFAHLGWADFLRSREGAGGVDPEASYRKALAEDPNNPYAKAMLGHWKLWRGGKLDDARRDFAD